MTLCIPPRPKVSWRYLFSNRKLCRAQTPQHSTIVDTAVVTSCTSRNRRLMGSGTGVRVALDQEYSRSILLMGYGSASSDMPCWIIRAIEVPRNAWRMGAAGVVFGGMDYHWSWHQPAIRSLLTALRRWDIILTRFETLAVKLARHRFRIQWQVQ
jgi:hypothetical protein